MYKMTSKWFLPISLLPTLSRDYRRLSIVAALICGICRRNFIVDMELAY
jgi:hypothetical protein